jgi:hypothetical protein
MEKLSPVERARREWAALKAERRERARRERMVLRGARYVRRHMAQAMGTTRRARKARARIRRIALARGAP